MRAVRSVTSAVDDTGSVVDEVPAEAFRDLSTLGVYPLKDGVSEVDPGIDQEDVHHLLPLHRPSPVEVEEPLHPLHKFEPLVGFELFSAAEA